MVILNGVVIDDAFDLERHELSAWGPSAVGR
jgi:hypothetical protein